MVQLEKQGLVSFFLIRGQQAQTVCDDQVALKLGKSDMRTHSGRVMADGNVEGRIAEVLEAKWLSASQPGSRNGQGQLPPWRLSRWSGRRTAMGQRVLDDREIIDIADGDTLLEHGTDAFDGMIGKRRWFPCGPFAPGPTQQYDVSAGLAGRAFNDEGDGALVEGTLNQYGHPQSHKLHIQSSWLYQLSVPETGCRRDLSSKSVSKSPAQSRCAMLVEFDPTATLTCNAPFAIG